MDKRNDVTILGAGPAGIAAAIYLKRAGCTPLVIERDRFGGLLRQAFLVENYPGFPRGITGVQLVEQMGEQLQGLGISMTKAEVTHVTKENETYRMKTNQGWLESPVIIIATGTHPRKIEINGSAFLENTRLFYDPFLLPLKAQKEKKKVIVIGGGDIAFDYTMTLLKWGYLVTLLSRSEPTCLPLLQDRVYKNGAKVLLQCVAEEIKEHTSHLQIYCQKDNQKIDLPADFLLVACGRVPNVSFLDPCLKECLESPGCFPQTVHPGLFVAGDVIRGTYR
ncbi:MAG: NAD(P)/FAD-dependent oxidoreductase, partial [Candidatus Thermoplasmatota archaeon]|nr:NAD(P)/FAD-dependent oxidoreductase [Candidatus Thermoplasmatota archaeon]